MLLLWASSPLLNSSFFRSSEPLFSRQISRHLAVAAAAASSSWSPSLNGRKKMSNPTNQGGYSNSTPRGSRSVPESSRPRQFRNRSGYSNPRSSHSPSVPESANSGQSEKNQRSSVSSGVQGSRHSSFRGSSLKQRSHGGVTSRIDCEQIGPGEDRNVKPNEMLLHPEGSMDQKDGTYSDDCACEDRNRSVEGVPQGVALSESALRQQDNERSDVSCFDICCPVEKNGPIKLRPPLHVRNKEKKLSNSREYLELQPGMILIRKYLNERDQVEIVSVCRQLGMDPGGFYQPGYSDGAKLHLWMMCLGKNWDPQTSKYEDIRSIDGVKPPAIPDAFRGLVERAIKDCHIYLEKNSREPVEAVLPAMTPDICIVNFYTESGRLGLHQDRDESRDSLHKGLPVVSFSIGDKADFLYGSDRDPDKAKKVVLDSGDLLIFGGDSRHIFHGVPRIITGSAPIFLSDETHLRPGRLNLTFRQYK